MLLQSEDAEQKKEPGIRRAVKIPGAEMTIYSSTFAWKIAWTEKSGRLQSIRSQLSDTTKVTQHSYSRYEEVFMVVGGNNSVLKGA